MVKPREDRAYGGKAGIFLKKRRKQAVHPVAAAANDDDHVLLPQTKVTPPSTTSNSTLMNINKNKNSNAGCETQNPSKQVLIGWDDERCRPIYRETSASSSGTCSSTASTSTIHNTDDESESQDDENGFRKEDDCSDVKDEHMGESASSVLVTSTNHTETLRKPRAYGSRKRVASLSSCHDIMDTQQRKRQHVTYTKKTDVDAASITTPSTNSRLTFDLETPQTSGLGNNICDALNSETKAAPRRDFDASNDSTIAFKTTKPAKKEKKSVSLATKPKSTKQPKLPVLAHLDFIDEHVSQPSSTTSLAAARAFFERLDAHQTLTLDASDTPVAHDTKKCVRTRRAISVEGNDGLQREYQAYVTATRATGVEPLSLEQYAANRSAFFRGDMYDGFLNG